jgi:hypothetical protein
MTVGALDHLVIGARTLAAGQAWMKGRLGVGLSPGGEHALFSTHNALLSLGPDSYLEVIAVNPHAPAPSRPRWLGLDSPELRERLVDGPQLIHWVVRVPALPPGPDVLELSRGDNRWALIVPGDGSLPGGGVQPSLIAWHTPPPPTSLPDVGVRLATLRLGTPMPDRLRAWLNAVQFVGEVEVYEAPQPELGATLQTPHGPVAL